MMFPEGKGEGEVDGGGEGGGRGGVGAVLGGSCTGNVGKRGDSYIIKIDYKLKKWVLSALRWCSAEAGWFQANARRINLIS